MAKRKITELEKNAFNYLDALRESGVTNMLGAGPYLVDEFGVTRAEARCLLTTWMDIYDGTGQYDEIDIQ